MKQLFFFKFVAVKNTVVTSAVGSNTLVGTKAPAVVTLSVPMSTQ